MKPLVLALLFGLALKHAFASEALVPIAANVPHTLVANPKVRVAFGEERLVLAGGLQP